MAGFETPFRSASTVPEELLIVSKIVAARTHWDASAGKARLCAGELCKLCRDGWGLKDRYLIRFEDLAGYHSLMEFSDRCASVFREVSDHQRRGRSCVVEVQRVGSAKNSPIRIDILREVSFPSPFDISNLIAAKYLPMMEIGEIDHSFEAFPPSPVGQIKHTAKSDMRYEDLENSERFDRLKNGWH